MSETTDRPTTVISVRGRDRDALLADPDFLYVGRGVYRGVHWKPSIWGNPFKVGMKRARAVATLGADIDCLIRAETLDVYLCLAFYRAWLRRQPLDPAPLAGKRLGCWCGCWAPGQPEIDCHAVVLAQWADRVAGGMSR